MAESTFPSDDRRQRISTILLFRPFGGPVSAQNMGSLRPAGPPRTREAARAELEALSDEDLEATYKEVTQQEARKLLEQREREEAKRAFNAPTAMADFEYWGKYSYWSIEEAVALVLGRDPKIVNSKSLRPYANTSAFVAKFDRLASLARRAVAMGQLTDGVTPGVFITWAKRYDIEVPTGLERVVTQYGGYIGDWKTLYDTACQRLKAAQVSELKAVTEVGGLRAQVESLTARLEHLSKKEKFKRVDPREVESLRKLAIGMAVKGYGYDPAAARSEKVSEIAGDLEMLGIELDADTVRRHLKASADLLPREEISTKK